MKKFKKNPEIIEAIQYDGENIDSILAEGDGQNIIVDDEAQLFILSEGGEGGPTEIHPTDWLVKDNAGVLWRMTNKVMKEDYNPTVG